MQPVAPENQQSSPPYVHSERPLGDLFRTLASEGSQLVRQELALARAELKQSAQEFARHGARVVGWASVAGAGGLALVAFLIVLAGMLLGERYWLGALIVGAVLVAVGTWGSYRAAQRLRRGALAPEHTIASLRTTGGWAQAEASEFRSVLTNGGREAHEAGASPNPRRETAHTERSVRSSPPPYTSGRTERTRGSHPEEQRASRAGGGRKRSREGSLPKSLWRNFREDDVLNQAAGLAYFAFLSLPPSILVLFALTGFFGGEQAADWITMQLASFLPNESGSLIEGFVQNIVHDQAPGPFSIGLLLALWAASNVFMAIARALNSAYDIDDPRSWIKQRALAVGVMLLFVVLFLSGSAVLIAGPQIASAMNLYGVADAAWSVLQWVLPFAVIVAAIWMVYYILPARDQKRSNREILIGAVIAAVVWLVASLGFRFYISNFGSYNETYGFLGAIIVLLLWLYISGFVILMGGQLAAELEARARK